jgi:alkanesulfonate monooxygenase SsuD/methylene tetrahydromethanopterin reductase-like flavin-dependent oxidoreductase (luciferase family)
VTKFGLICPIQRRDATLDVLLDELAEEVVAAEAAGFDSFFFTEFHQAHGGALVSPLLLCAWLGARTSRIKMGTLVLATPLHDPVRLAEDALMLDWASRGRLILGLGVAHQPPDFALFGVPRERRARIFDEALDVLEACWSDADFDYAGEVFRRRGHVTPGPYTRPRPPIWIGAHAPAGLRRAAQRGDAWVCDPQRDIETVARLADAYRAEAREAGRDARVVLFREAWVDESREAAEAVWAPHALKVHRLYFNVGTYLPEFEPWVSEIRSREDFTLQRVAPGRFAYGSGAEVRDELASWAHRTGADTVCVRMRHPTGPTHEEALRAIERFGREVIASSQDGFAIQPNAW